MYSQFMMHGQKNIKLCHKICFFYADWPARTVIWMYVETIKKSQLCDFLFLKLKLAHFDDINTIQEQLQTALASLKAQDFCEYSEQLWNHW